MSQVTSLCRAGVCRRVGVGQLGEKSLGWGLYKRPWAGGAAGEVALLFGVRGAVSQPVVTDLGERKSVLHFSSESY